MVVDVTKHHNVCIYEWKKTTNQRFKIHHVGNGRYSITNIEHNTIISVPNGSNQNGEHLKSLKSHGHQNELWEFVPCMN